MNIKQLGIVLLVVGIAIYALKFITVIVNYLFSTWYLGLASLALIAGAGLIIYNYYKESSED
ncbi:MAG: hypothetical protein H8E64_01740 [Candidatus Marinimicrobia bacterium]|nr:hypothetical protein [Candidatus Neomarinimicrobiota bacterium]